MGKQATFWLLICLSGSACSASSGQAEGAAAGGGAGGGAFVPELPVFIPASVVCREPLAGEPPGASAGGLVCTMQSVAGATEEGRSFRDYADCNVVRTQRPYYPVPRSESYRADDPRTADPAYAAELAWVRAQIDAVGCSCCHADGAPQGPVRWSIDLPGNWATSFSDRDLAAMANWIDTSMFERFPPAMNNGFERPHGLPSTDPARVEAFFAAEARHRGLAREAFADAPPTGAILLEQAAYVPSPCENGEGVDVGGAVSWTGGPARYVYVLSVGSDNPSVPPDRDTPAGTLWRVDVPPSGLPLATGALRYGEAPEGATQRVPAAGAPAALQAGRDYYLYVARDVYQPMTRCLFTYPR